MDKYGNYYDASFEVTSNALIATDPCYLASFSHVNALIENVENGKWLCKTEYSDEGAWGKRVKSLSAHLETDHSHTGLWETIKNCGVDSGQFGFFDLKYFLDQGESREYDEESNFYHKVCKLTYNEETKHQSGVIENSGVVSSSGYGDGSYNVKVARNKNGKVVAVQVDYFDEENDYYDEE